ncbi:MAG: type II toxin-antitoxin system RelE/ParE family toxin [Propionibacteriaceae bacterium]|jgi:proteic killer suppression protein|nr:type II toxin-antitoxin system RelE/ParE family toxin [Propionibacteriaceae bacterium]
MADIDYADKHIERLCTDERFMVKGLGAEVAKQLKRRIAELRWAPVVEDLLMTTGRWEELTGDRLGQWSARLGRNWRLIVEANRGDTLIIVIEAIDYH